MDHTPTPWQTAKSGYTGSEVYGCDSDGLVIFHTLEINRALPVQEANAQFIVRACNSHQDLIRIIKTAICHIAEAKVPAPDPRAYKIAQNEWLNEAHDHTSK